MYAPTNRPPGLLANQLNILDENGGKMSVTDLCFEPIGSKLQMGITVKDVVQVPTLPNAIRLGTLYTTPHGNYLFGSHGCQKIEGPLEFRELGDGFICFGEFDWDKIPRVDTIPVKEGGENEKDNENLTWQSAVLEGIKPNNE